MTKDVKEDLKAVTDEVKARNVAMKMRQDFAKIMISDLNKTKSGRGFLKKYTQSQVRDIIEGYKHPINQKKLREISNILWAKSPQYQSLIGYLSTMSLFIYILTPKKDIRKASPNKVKKELSDMAEFLATMKIKHEMTKVLLTAFKDDIFYGYVHKDKDSFYIQPMDFYLCKISSIEDGVYNYSVDMSVFRSKPDNLIGMPEEIKSKYRIWESEQSKGEKLDSFVELDPENTICIKINEEIVEAFPPYAGSFDAIFDIEGFKRLRKDKEELGNYMMLAQKVPIRVDTDENNDFVIDEDTMRMFHNTVAETVPENVGVITSPMDIEPIKFEKDRVDFDGVAKSERDFWTGVGSSIFSIDKTTSQGLLMSIKTDEQIVFKVIEQIQRWLNRYLSYNFKNSMFQAKILPVTYYNRDEMFKMYLEASTYGIPVKSHVSAVMELEPIETMNMAYMENEILNMNEEFVPLQSAHTMPSEPVPENGSSANGKDGRPPKDEKNKSDETARADNKPNKVVKK